MTWILYICIGVSWAGCGSIRQHEFPTADTCFRALKEMRTGDQPVAESEKKRNTVAYCHPKQQETRHMVDTTAALFPKFPYLT